MAYVYDEQTGEFRTTGNTTIPSSSSSGDNNNNNSSGSGCGSTLFWIIMGLLALLLIFA